MRGGRTPRRIRVLTLVDGIGTYGGGESLARLIAMGLDNDRFESIFCVSRWNPETTTDPAVARALDDLTASGTEFIGLERQGRHSAGPWLELIRRMRRGRVDVLHSHKFGSNAWGSMITAAAQTPVFVAHEHTWSFDGNRTRMLADRHLIGRRADAVVAVSRDDRRKMIEIEGLRPQKVIFIPNGIPDPAYAEPGQLRAELGLDGSVPVLGAVATLRPQKALEVMIEAMAVVARSQPAAKLVIAGGDDQHHPGLRDELRAQAERLGVGGSVVMLGLRSDVPAVIADFDIALSSSDFEGSPLSLMECMEAAKPVVATAVGGVPDLVADGETGLLVPPRDPEALAAAAVALIEDPDRSRRIGEAGRQRRRREFSLDATIGRIEDLYDRLLGER